MDQCRDGVAAGFCQGGWDCGARRIWGQRGRGQDQSGGLCAGQECTISGAVSGDADGLRGGGAQG